MAFKSGERIPRKQALRHYETIKAALVAEGIRPDLIEVGGSIRREKPDVGDIDIAIFDDQKVNKAFYGRICARLEKDRHTVTVRCMGDVQASVSVDDILFEFKKAPPESKGAMLLHITGSGDFNMGLRSWVKARGYLLNQYGLYNAETGEQYPSTTEKGIFQQLGLVYVEPAFRNQFLAIPNCKRARPTPEPAKAKNDGVPKEILARLPKDIRAKVEKFSLPEKDGQGIPIPADFLWNKEARQRYYIRSGIWKREHKGKIFEGFRIPDELKLNRYLEAS
jgi:hypothetical protein